MKTAEIRLESLNDSSDLKHFDQQARCQVRSVFLHQLLSPEALLHSAVQCDLDKSWRILILCGAGQIALYPRGRGAPH